MGGDRRENKICFLVLFLSRFEILRIPKASDTPVFKCKSKWCTATMMLSRRDRLARPASIRKDGGKWAAFRNPSPTSTRTWQPEGLLSEGGGGVSWRKPSHWESNGSFWVWTTCLYTAQLFPPPPLPAGPINATSSPRLAWRDVP